MEKVLIWAKNNCTKENIKTIRNLLAAKKIGMESMKASSLMESETEKESSYGLMDKLTKDNGRTVKRMGLAFGSL